MAFKRYPEFNRVQGMDTTVGGGFAEGREPVGKSVLTFSVPGTWHVLVLGLYQPGGPLG